MKPFSAISLMAEALAIQEMLGHRPTYGQVCEARYENYRSILSDYRKGMALRKIAKNHNTSQDSIIAILKQHGDWQGRIK